MQLYEMTVRELQTLLKSKKVSAVEILDSVFGRINDVEKQIQAFITVTEEIARKQAVLQDQEAVWEGLRGIPVGLEDLICTQGVKTTCASKMLENFTPFYTATCARKLFDEGAILAGKLNMDEFAVGSSTEYSAFLQTHNPWDLSRVPGGSSGGSAAAVAADEVPFALGTDTGGSIRQPAAFCGIVGFKPTYGRVSRYGIVAFASSLEQVGTLTKDVTDAALIMNIISGRDTLDSNTADVQVPNYSEALEQDIRGLKIGFPREYFQQGVSEPVKAAVMSALKKYEEMGANIEEVSLPYSEYALPAYHLIGPAEASTNLARFDGVRFGLRDFESDNVVDMFSESRAAGFGDNVKKCIMLGTYVLSADCYDTYYVKAMQVRRLIKEDFNKVFEQVDVLACPTTPDTAFAINEFIDNPLTIYMNDMLTVPVNMAGLPGLSLPCGFHEGLPIGLQLIGKPFDESTLLRTAYAFEQQTDYHKQKPQLKGE